MPHWHQGPYRAGPDRSSLLVEGFLSPVQVGRCCSLGLCLWTTVATQTQSVAVVGGQGVEADALRCRWSRASQAAARVYIPRPKPRWRALGTTCCALLLPYLSLFEACTGRSATVKSLLFRLFLRTATTASTCMRFPPRVHCQM